MIDPTHDPRVAGQITRFHTWPRIRDQSVGEHTWQVLRIMLAIWPDCPRKLLVHGVIHDAGEMAGDIPYPFKRNDQILKDRMDAAEASIRDKMYGLPEDIVLSHYEQKFFKLCEFLDMWEFGLHEINLGNNYAFVVATRCIIAASSILENMEPEQGYPDIRASTKRYCDWRQKQDQPDTRPQLGEQNNDQ